MKHDAAYEATEQQIKSLERKIKKEFKTASKGVEAKLQKHFADFEAKDAKKRALLTAGEIDTKEYARWRYGQMAVGTRWASLRKSLAMDYRAADKVARQMVVGSKARVFAINGNFAMYEIEKSAGIDMSFALYSEKAVERLIKNNPQILPDPSTSRRLQKEISEGRAILWQEGQIQSAITQGILQGMSIPELSSYIAENVGARNDAAAMRYARTAMTEAQNAGRYDGYRKADSLGVDLTIEWMATLDNRTRHSHRYMHGQRRKVDEPFVTPDGDTLLYPADCSGDSDLPQREIWNCRCSLSAMVKGYELETVRESPKMRGMSFEEWLDAKPESKPYPIRRDKDG